MQHTVSTVIEQPMDVVQAFVVDVQNLPRWSFFTSAEPEGDHWRVRSSDGEATLTFVAPHEPGVLDHVVVTDTGHHVVVPMRVSQHGACHRSEVTLVVDGPEDAMAADIATVEADLARLKELLEASP